MKISIFKDYDELSLKTADLIADLIRKKPDAILCFPAGHTPLGTFHKLMQYSLEGKIDMKGCKFVGLDEWLGLDQCEEGSCLHFLYKHFFHPLCIPESNITFFDTAAIDLQKECIRIDDYLCKNGPIDLMLLGLGLNGHLGMNEPRTSFQTHSHVVKLDEVTKRVGQKYFNRQVALDRGITLGMEQIMQSKTVILQANGNEKASILKRIIDGKISEELPASILKKHNNCFLYLDAQAGHMLD